MGFDSALTGAAVDGEVLVKPDSARCCIVVCNLSGCIGIGDDCLFGGDRLLGEDRLFGGDCLFGENPLFK